MQTHNNIIEQGFENYISQVYKDINLHPTQKIELRKAFYAAAWFTLEFVATVSYEYDEDKAAAILDKLKHDIQSIRNEVNARN